MLIDQEIIKQEAQEATARALAGIQLHSAADVAEALLEVKRWIRRSFLDRRDNKIREFARTFLAEFCPSLKGQAEEMRDMFDRLDIAPDDYDFRAEDPESAEAWKALRDLWALMGRKSLSSTQIKLILGGKRSKL